VLQKADSCGCEADPKVPIRKSQKGVNSTARKRAAGLRMIMLENYAVESI
jgi:hypothetical protein